MRVIFMGTPDFAVSALQSLDEESHEICAVYTQPPRPAKRGKRYQKSPVHVFAEDKGFEVRVPKSFKDLNVCEGFRDLAADVAVVVAYGLILPESILSIPQHGCLNIHASLLPRWRGAAPIQRAIEAGDQETGISIMQMEAGLDTGPVLIREEIAIAPQETAGTLHDRLATLGAQSIVKALAELNQLHPRAQDSDKASYAAKITKQECEINWAEPADLIARKIRAFSPFPGAWFNVGGERIKVLNARPAGSHSALTVGGVELLTLQRAGKRPQEAADFLRGFPVDLGALA